MDAVILSLLMGLAAPGPQLQESGRASGSFTIEIAESLVRGGLPADGVLIARGDPGGDCMWISFGRRVRAQGEHVYVSDDERVGERGVSFRDGYIEMNLGIHVEGATFLKGAGRIAIDSSVTAKIWIDDRLRIVVHPLWNVLEGDNLGGKAAVKLMRGDLLKALEGRIEAIAEEVSAGLRKSFPPGSRAHVTVRPGMLTAVLGPRPAGTPLAPGRWAFLCREADACGHERLVVHGADGDVEVRRGETRDLRVRLDADGRFFWHCGPHEEKTRPSDRGATVVVVHRAASGDDIEWYCYRELSPDP
ncbi:hypothetical protein [Paludisphaera mucosa]|uniref:FecR protein domain-containing protein n=1 Tax=Paludisphaera mucosa TaxID=3030827 RepID=A0ABT6F4B0_9BACT|nr:hypothetical protein [Paludisphaera mucosa]MDG3002421.1 hypothetical protein [Paludisphaera mucosa]